MESQKSVRSENSKQYVLKIEDLQQNKWNANESKQAIIMALLLGVIQMKHIKMSAWINQVNFSNHLYGAACH